MSQRPALQGTDALTRANGRASVARLHSKVIKTSWHMFLVTAAVIEYFLAESRLRKNLCLSCAGWHLSCAIGDYIDKEE